MIVDGLRNDDPHIDHRADRDRDAGERHDVGVHAEDVHGDECHQDGDGQRRSDHNARPHVQQEQQNHHGGDEDFFGERGGQGSDGFIDQSRAIVDAIDRHAFEARFDLPNLRLHPLDDLPWVLAEPHDDDSADRLGPIQVNRPTPEVGTELHHPQITDTDRDAITGLKRPSSQCLQSRSKRLGLRR